MTGGEWIAKYLGVGKKIRDSRVIFFATTGTMAQMSERIWGKGGLSDGGTIAYKEDYSLYAYTPPAPRKVSGKGKPYAEWKRPHPAKGTAAKIKGGYYPTYLAFKAQQGRKDNPFELTADLRKSWLNGVTPKPTEIDPLICVVGLSKAQAVKADGLTASKGEFLKLTNDEKKEHLERVRDLYRSILE